MRRLIVPAATLLLLFNSITTPGQQSGLQLTASIIDQQSCVGGGSLDSLRLTLQLRYTNVGRERLILYKGNRLFFQIFISRGGEDSAAARNELRTTHSRYFDEQPEKIVSNAPGGVFTTISPGASYETRQVIHVPVARGDGAALYNVSIPEGEHVLSVAASTWYESRNLAEELRERWRSRGFLWTEPLASNPVAFIVGKERSLSTCR
jgi:hypothetical protein